MANPAWVEALLKEPCRCVPCGTCRGTGSIQVDDPTQPEGWDLETCDECCGSGLAESCERCVDLDDWDREDA